MREESTEAHQEEEDTLIEVSLEEKDGSRIEREVTAEEDTTLNQETEGGFSSDWYRASVCDIEKGTFFFDVVVYF